MLDIELACSGSSLEFVGGAIVGVFIFVRKALLMICFESNFGIGLEGFEPGGELDAC